MHTLAGSQLDLGKMLNSLQHGMLAKQKTPVRHKNCTTLA